MAGMRLSRPLGLGVVCPDVTGSPSSEDRVPWVVVENARAEGSSVGLLVGAVLMGGALGLDDQNAGIMVDREGLWKRDSVADFTQINGWWRCCDWMLDDEDDCWDDCVVVPRGFVCIGGMSAKMWERRISRWGGTKGRRSFLLLK